ncbi:MAG: L,D-transpeptidase [Eubacteriales bacterium]|nr:L,D-transpeptidase [Eubacteriales bacterium]
MELRKFEKIFIALAVILLLITGVVYAADALFSEDKSLEPQKSFNFASPSSPSKGEDDSSLPASQAETELVEASSLESAAESSLQIAPEQETKAVLDPRVGLELPPANESDLDRIKRLIAPESPGDTAKDYLIRVFKDRQLVTVFEDPQGDGSFDYLIKAFICSTAAEEYETPSGHHQIGLKLYSGFMMDASYGQYCSEFLQYHYLHAVPSYGGVEEAGVSWEDYNKLGQVASHGCIRLETKAAKWIYDYCREGTPVEILESSADFPYLPEKVDRLQMSPDGPSWDPTNPNPLNPYQQDPSLLLDYNRQS